MVESSGAQRRRAVATVKGNNESPAYSRGGDQSAGFYGCGIQRATRLQRVPFNNRSRHNSRLNGGVKGFGEEFAIFSGRDG